MKGKDTIIPSGQRPGIQYVPQGISGVLAGITRKALFSRLENIISGQLVIHEGPTKTVFGNSSGEETLSAGIYVRDHQFYIDTAVGGSIGAAEAYMAGLWYADNLSKVIRIIIRNRQVMTGLEGGSARISGPVNRLLHYFRKNSLKGSKKNIAAHYDLGNDFYSLFLDSSMTYSCGIFTSRESTLLEASREKYDRICRKLLLTSDDHLLEIGTGWGGFALHAAKHYGCRVTTTTISAEQAAYSRQLIAREGLQGRVEILMNDYRDLQGTFDKLVSIEMVEAVGHHYLDTFFRCCSERLKDDGVMLLQAITMTDQEFDQHKRSVEFIKRYIFPGSCIPSVTAMIDSVTRVTDMRLFHLEDITAHYARTLMEWRQGFFRNINEVRQLGYSEEFIKMWEYYLCYCEAGFSERYIGDVQMLFTKPCSRQQSILPEL